MDQDKLQAKVKGESQNTKKIGFGFTVSHVVMSTKNYGKIFLRLSHVQALDWDFKSEASSGDALTVEMIVKAVAEVCEKVEDVEVLSWDNVAVPFIAYLAKVLPVDLNLPVTAEEFVEEVESRV